MTPKILEKEILKSCLDYLSLKGIYVWRNNSGFQMLEYKGKKRPLRTGLPGSADILGLTKKGLFLAIECKRPGNVLTDAQIAFKGQIEANNGIYLVAYSVDDLITAGL